MKVTLQVLTVCFAALVNAACTDVERYEPSRSAGAYCVPRINLVDAPAWVVSADLAEAGGGFAFSACPGQEGDCDAPTWLSGGVVESAKQSIFGRSVGEILHFDVLAMDIRSASRIASVGAGLISVEGRGEFGNIYVFRQAAARNALAPRAPGDLTKDDVLLASCRKPRHLQSVNSLQGGDRIYCRRAFEREGMLIQYSLSVDSLSDLRDVDDRDEDVYSFLAGWRCR